MKTFKRFFTVAILIGSSLIVNSQTFLSPPPKSEQRSDTIVKSVRPFDISRINAASIETYSLQNRSYSRRLTESQKGGIQRQVDTTISQINEFFLDTLANPVTQMNYRELESLEKELSVLGSRIITVQESIFELMSNIQSTRDALLANQDRWNLTLRERVDNRTSPAIERRIRTVISSSDSVLKALQSDMDFLFTQADYLTDQEIRLDQLSSEVDELISFSSRKLLRRDMPPFWGLFKDSDLPDIGMNQIKERIGNETTMIVNVYGDQLALSLVVLILAIVFILWLKQTAFKSNLVRKKVFISLYINEIFSKPVEVSFLIGFYLFFLLIKDVPPFYGTLVAVAAVYALLRVALGIIPSGYKKILSGFAVAYFLIWFYNLIYDYHVTARLVLLGAQLLVLFALLAYLGSRRMIHSEKYSSFNKALSFTSIVFVIFLVVAALSNIAGILSFSELVTGGVVKSGFFIISTYIGYHFSVALVFLSLSSTLMQKSKIIKEQTNYLMGKLSTILRFVFVVITVFVILEQFDIREAVTDWVSGFLNKEFKIGKASLTLISLIIFVFVIWLSIFISRVIRHILQEEVFTRVEVERGMPGTITMLVRITVISVGFMLAAAAAGMKLSNLTIIIGAFSVGIGFGLQNIFNNLVSGLILAFERPIKEGDIVEVNALLGTVKKIGIRSSIVRTFDGAEVIVPNGTLISNDLVNWTLSDQFRRADLRIGVAYGTDPEKVTAILLQCAETNSRVLNAPKSKAYFIGFGDSSLDFRLLAWIDQDHRLEVESEIRISVNRALKEAGIEIPFPQRDLHVKSMTDSVGQKISKK